VTLVQPALNILFDNDDNDADDGDKRKNIFKRWLTYLCGRDQAELTSNKEQANSAFHPLGVDKWVVDCN